MTRACLLLLALASCAAHGKKWQPHPTLGDADGDGILDHDDLCPAEAEDRDGYADDDGCPDPDCDDCCDALSRMQVRFFPDRIALAPAEFPIVVTIANAVRARPELRELTLEAWGPLAALRMTAIRDALHKLGIALDRIRLVEAGPEAAIPADGVRFSAPTTCADEIDFDDAS